MDIKDILKNRRLFSSSLEEYIKIILGINHSKLNAQNILNDKVISIHNYFSEFHKKHTSLKEQFLYCESQIQEINLTIKQLSSNNLEHNEFLTLKENIIKKKSSLKDRIEKLSLTHLSYALSLFDKLETEILTIILNNKDYPHSPSLVKNNALIEEGFPLLLEFCHQWESENIFYALKINKGARNVLANIQKAQKQVFKLKTAPFPFYDTKEYKNLSSYLPLITQSIDDFVDDKLLWQYIKNNTNEFPELIGFINTFDKKDFKSIRSKVRIFSSLDKTEELLNIIKNSFRQVENQFSVYLYQLEVQKKEILKLCLHKNEYKEYLIKEFVKKHFSLYFSELKNIENSYQRKLLKF